MHWQLKAGIQNAVSWLPPKFSYDVYYFLQRRFGNLRRPNPITHLRAGAAIVDLIRRQNLSVDSKSFIEVGTGRRLGLPIALWLCGAVEVLTLDLNPYLKPELVFEDIAYMRENRDEVIKLFPDHVREQLFQDRLDTLMNWNDRSISSLLRALGIQYLAPADATLLHIPSQSADYHISYTVLEHISPQTILRLFLEGKRVLRRSGLFIHLIDFSDHFSHSDKSISSVNFLQFSELEWEKYTGNRYMYHNRLRLDEFLGVLAKAQVEIIALDTKVDERALQVLEENRLSLDERFRSKSRDVLATSSAWVVAR